MEIMNYTKLPDHCYCFHGFQSRVVIQVVLSTVLK